MPINEATIEATFQKMKAKLSKLVPEVELRYKAELVFEINRLKVERDAVILGHNYMEPALFSTVPDFIGDSLELARQAAKTEKSVIVFCGVQFMAETAKILNPSKTVLIPSQKAGCSLAAGITAADVRMLRAKYPGVPVVTYINSYAEVKAESDLCCTSGNSIKVINSLNSDHVIYLPDEFMAQNIAKEMDIHFQYGDTSEPLTVGRKTIIGWRARCEVHEKFTVEDITRARKQFPGVEVITHPECPPAVVAASDISTSTSAMLKHVRQSKAPHFLVLTECSMGDNIIAENPDKDILRLCSIRCPHMNQITLEDTALALREMQYQVTVPEDIRLRAYNAVQRMIEIG